MLEETNDSGTVLARYTTASPSYFSPLLHMWRSSSTSRFPLYDLTGSARGLVDANGAVTDSYELDAFGRTVSSSGSTVNPYKYDAAWGYITDSSGFQQLGARFYWPEIGRFVQQDPAGDGMNWYAYAYGSPVRWTDPTGLASLSFDAYAGLGGGITLGWDPEDGLFMRARAGVGFRMAGSLSMNPVDENVGAGYGIRGHGSSYGLRATVAAQLGRWGSYVGGTAFDAQGNSYAYPPISIPYRPLRLEIDPCSFSNPPGFDLGVSANIEGSLW